MIFNQSEHELQYGIIEIKDGKDSFVLAVSGSKEFEPSIILTPYGINANLNTFVMGPCKWGSLVLEPDDGQNVYDLNQTWRAKSNLAEYDAKANLKVWWRLNEKPLSLVDLVIADSSGNGVNSIGQNQNNQKPDRSLSTPSTYIATTTLDFENTVGGAAHGNVAFFKASYWNSLVGGEGPTTNGGTSGPGNSMSISFWFRPLDWTENNDGQIIFLAGDNVGAGSFRGVVMSTNGSSFKGIRIGWNAGLPKDNSYAGTNFAGSYNVALNTWHHAVITRSGAEWSGSDWVGGNPYKFYLDGVEYTDVTYAAVGGGGIKPNPIVEAASPNARLGYNSVHGFSGDLSDFAIWDTELTATQVEALYGTAASGVEDAETIRAKGDVWWAVIKRSTDIGDVNVQYQAIGASPLRVK